MVVDLSKLVVQVEAIAFRSSWVVDRKFVASTGSTYLELVRDGREWVVIRIADHRQYYKKYLTTYSIDPSSDGWFVEDIAELLNRPFGDVGDVLL